ncbi:MAG: hypothetical protein ACLFR0_09130 [Alphaproteobacteria bacterium]
MKQTKRSKALSIALWRDNNILDFIGVILLFAACLAVSAIRL